jgi:hypothetical protein
MALHVAEEAEQPMNQHLQNRRAYVQYAERPKLTKPFFLFEPFLKRAQQWK